MIKVERKLRNRRKRAKLGRTIRVSDFVYDSLDKMRRGKSWDYMFRRMFGMPDRHGNEQPLIEGLLETNTGKFFLRPWDVTWAQLEEDAYEVAIMAAAKQGSKRIARPLRMRELP